MSPGIGVGISPFIGRRAALPYPAVLNDGNTVGFYDYLLGITKDGANLVSAWNSIIGANHLLQATGTNQPLWSANGVLFDGIDNFMKCVAFTWNQPEFLYLVMKQVTWTNADRIWDGNTLTSVMCYQQGVTPNLGVYSGTTQLNNTNLAINTWGIVRVLYNGAGSKFIINNTTPVTGNAGTNSAAGFTLGADGNNLQFSNIQVKEIINRVSTLGEAAIYAYLATKYGL